jgi:Ca2+-binding RTX toxin-like protein
MSLIDTDISRIPIGTINASCIPYCKLLYKQHDIDPAGSSTLPIRVITLMDDIDLIGGNDLLYGSEGDDVIHGQHGNDFLGGDDGNDELFGDEGNDTISGDDGFDVILGDSGKVVRKVLQSSATLEQYDYYLDHESGLYFVHKDIVLEEMVNITRVIPISTAQSSTGNSLAASILGADYVLLSGAYPLHSC